MKATAASAILAFLLATGVAFGADSGSSSTRRDPALERYNAAATQQDWKSAVQVMQQAIASDPRNPDYHSLYAYSLRKSGTPDMDIVFKEYNEALRLDPRHKGAHEYLGEAYLMVGNVEKAREHLSALDKLCFFGCSEYDELKKAISTYEAKAK
jgi:Tfp pilus assembly protein PilF